MTTLKHQKFVSEPIGDKGVDKLPGIGPVLGGRLEKNGFDKAYMVLEQFLVLERNKRLFIDWIKGITGANIRQASDCCEGLSEWLERNPYTIKEPAYQTVRQEKKDNLYDGVTTTGDLVHTTDGVEWKISHYSSIFKKVSHESPLFSLAGCEWKLEFIRNGCIDLLIRLLKTDRMPVLGSLTCAIGIKCEDGALQEAKRTFVASSVDNGVDIPRPALDSKLDGNIIRQSLRISSDIVTFFCNMCGEQMLSGLKSLSSDLKDLLSSERACDITLKVQGKDFRAHRLLLSSRSPVFRAMYEHDTSENQTGVVNISDCDPDSFDKFLNYLYTGRAEITTFQTAYHLYATAEKYDVKNLKSLCGTYMMLNLTEENFCDVIELADLYSDEKLESSIQTFFSNRFHKILLTAEWMALLGKNFQLAQKWLLSLKKSMKTEAHISKIS